MTNKLFSLFVLVFIGCSHQTTSNPPSGTIEPAGDAYTYQAEYKGKENLKVGDKVKIMQYDFGDSLKHKQTRAFPISGNKKQIGEATVSNVLDKNHYELKTKNPGPLPGNVFIEKF